jgi:hypothetical protein
MVDDRGPFVASAMAEGEPAAPPRGRGRISHAAPIPPTAMAPSRHVRYPSRNPPTGRTAGGASR